MNKVITMERKVSKFGNSLGITMTEALKQVGLDLGDTVRVDVRESEGEIVIKKIQKVSLPTGISSDFLDTLAEVMGEYDETLKGLKDR
ncbi:AbrB family transcriptional regulator [Paenibacillus humicola]|uniref:AbrB/MazE/SpoVT family DNA-binding domain-containing protein n=1 Tax=Paenibacillus humicola TaxID=3110540 RepID=UPI00237BA3E0|nr:AbrB family transcriptional regulator [Paenibacillus humicola]